MSKSWEFLFFSVIIGHNIITFLANRALNTWMVWQSEEDYIKSRLQLFLLWFMLIACDEPFSIHYGYGQITIENRATVTYRRSLNMRRKSVDVDIFLSHFPSWSGRIYLREITNGKLFLWYNSPQLDYLKWLMGTYGNRIAPFL